MNSLLDPALKLAVGEADFAAITERDFDVETWQPLPACMTHEND